MRDLVAPGDLRSGVPAPVVTLGGEVSGATVLVDLELPFLDSDREAVHDALSRRTAVVVGVSRSPLGPAADRLAQALDLTLAPQGGRHVVARPDPLADASRLADRLAAAPRAGLVLTALLRQTGHLSVPDGLAAEAAAYSTLLSGPEHARWLAARGPARPHVAGQVRVLREAGALHVTLDRPKRRNALDALMRNAFVDALEVAVLEDLDVTVDGAGEVFCSGGDLDEFGTAADPATAWVVRLGAHPGRSLARLGPRTTVLLHGACAGAGVEIAAFAHRLDADPAAMLRLPELDLGLLPGAGGTVSLPVRIGRWRTAWMALSGEAVDAATARDWGLVDEVRVLDGSGP